MKTDQLVKVLRVKGCEDLAGPVEEMLDLFLLNCVVEMFREAKVYSDMGEKIITEILGGTGMMPGIKASYVAEELCSSMYLSFDVRYKDLVNPNNKWSYWHILVESGMRVGEMTLVDEIVERIFGFLTAVSEYVAERADAQKPGFFLNEKRRLIKLLVIEAQEKREERLSQIQAQKEIVQNLQKTSDSKLRKSLLKIGCIYLAVMLLIGFLYYSIPNV